MRQEDKDFINNIHAGLEGITDPVEIYNRTAPLYEKVSTLVGLPLLANRLVEFLCQCAGTEDLSRYVTIDTGCGTGNVGVELTKKGCKTLHGMDCSQGMIDECAKKNVYTKLFTAMLTSDPTLNIKSNEYDIVLSCCCYEPGAVSLDTLPEIIRMAKPGGLIVFTILYPYHSVDYMGLLGKMVKGGLVDLLQMKRTPYALNSDNDYEGWIYGYLVALKKK